MGRYVVIGSIAVLLMTAGCQQRRQYDPDRVPPDFALAFCVQFENDRSFVIEPLDNSAIFIVEPNGYLRAAIGPGCSLQTFPAPTKTLNRTQLKALYRLCRLAELNHNPDVFAPPVDPPRYQVVLGAWGKSYNHDIRMKNDDALAELHRELLHLAGIKTADEYRLFGR